jgi:drug/metabolite transporter (DMT)-like permease
VSINYCIAFTLCLTLCYFNNISFSIDTKNPLLYYGLINGAIYFGHFLIITSSFRYVGLGISTAVMSTGATLPVFTSWIGGEAVSYYQFIGMALLPLAVFLIRPKSKQHKKLSWKADIFLFLTFLGAGLIGVLHSEAGKEAKGDEIALYYIALFFSAACFACLYLLVSRKKPSRFELASGTAIGILNVFMLVFLMLALEKVSPVIIFPVGSCAIIFLNLIMAYILWKEKLVKRQLLGCFLVFLVIGLMVLK